MSRSNSTASIGDITARKRAITELAQTGQAEQAEALCRVLCEQTPGDPEAWFLLGAINGQLSRFPEAEHCCKQAIIFAPQHPMLHFNLAIAYQNQGKLQASIDSFEQAIKLQPDFADAYLELGNTQVLNNQPSQAINFFRKAVQLNPAAPVAHLNMGNAYRMLEDWNTALECYGQAIRIAPDMSEAYCQTATVLISTFKFSHAIELLESALEHIHESAEIFLRLAIAYQEQGDTSVAYEYFNKTLEIDGNNIDAQAGIAGILGLQGDFQTACRKLEAILDTDPDNVSAIIAYAHFSHHVGSIDKAIEIVEAALEQGKHPDRTRSKLHFSLAQLYERKGETDTAFEHYLAGNRLRDAKFDFSAYQDMSEAIKKTYTARAIRQFPRASRSAKTPVFIVGMPRSGTSLAEQILASHPDVFGAGELHYINAMVDRLPGELGASTPYPQCLDSLKKPVLDKLAGEYLGHLTERLANVSTFTDKMPLNFMHIGLIELLFPNAKIIHCTRNPIDTCLSCFFKSFSGEHPYAYSLTDLGRFYRLYTQLMSHWESVTGLPVHTLVYENVVADQEKQTRDLVAFCELDWNDQCLEFHKTKRTVSTASFDQVRQPIYTRSVERWRTYEQHLEPLLSALQADN